MVDRANVLFLVVDSLRYDAVFGEGSVDTPNVDALTRECVTFSNCFSQGISTAPSMTAMLTGRYPLEYGGHWYVEEGQPTFAEEFRSNGFATGAIHSNPNVSRLRNFDKGFDTFEENILPLQVPDWLASALPGKLLMYANKVVRLASRTPYLPADSLNDGIEGWIEEQREPWFMWTQYMDVHGPYLPGDAFSFLDKMRSERLWRKAAVNAPEDVSEREREELWENYGREVQKVDREIGRIIDFLRETGRLESTVIVVTSDHGDEFGEYGRYGHGNLPYDVLTHVPLMIRFPEDAKVEQPQTIDGLVRTVDILPTVLDFVGADLSPDMQNRMRGESLMPLIQSGVHPSFDVVVTEKEMRGGTSLRFGFRTERWKLLYDGEEDRVLLYDLDADPEEETDVSIRYPEVVERFRENLENRLRVIEETSRDIVIPEIEESSGVEERLKALGYM